MTELTYRLLGRSGLRVSELCLGTMGFGRNASWGTDAPEAAKIYDTFREAGGNYLDTANQYGDGASESIIRDLIGGHREEVVLASKYTNSAPGRGPNAGGNQRKNMVQSVEASLQRLGTDYLDLYIAHIWDSFTPTEELMRGLDDLVRSGKVLYVGMSNAPAWVVSRANMLAELRGWTPFVALQIQYSLLARDVERELIPMAHAGGLAVLAWSPLKNGLLTGKYRPDAGNAESGETGRMSGEQFAKAYSELAGVGGQAAATIAEVVAVAGELGAEPSQVALAWLLQQPGTVIPVVGARTTEQLVANLDAATVVLSPEHLNRLDAVSSIPLGYPYDYLASDVGRGFRTGGTFDRIRP